VDRIKSMRNGANELMKAMTRMKQLIDQVPQANRARVVGALAGRVADPTSAVTIQARLGARRVGQPGESDRSDVLVFGVRCSGKV
jgi:hypothetical protein